MERNQIKTFEDYEKYLNGAEEHKKRLNRKIDYRTIQLIGRRFDTSTIGLLINNVCAKSAITDEEQWILNNDDILRSLRHQLEMLEKESNFVQAHGAFPLSEMEIDTQMNKRCEDVVNEIGFMCGEKKED